MGVMKVLFDQAAAVASLTSWLHFTVGQWYSQQQIRRGQRNAPADAQRQVSVVPLTTVPVDESWTPVVQTQKQLNVVTVEVAVAAPGTYTLHTRSGEAVYVAGAGDTTTSIRDALRAAVDALAGPYVTADVGASAFSVTGTVAGQWLAVYPTVLPAAGALVVTTVDDVLRRTTWTAATWTVSLIVDDLRPQGAGEVSVVPQAANYVKQVLSAGQVPITLGSAQVFADDLLFEPGRLVTLTVGDALVFDYQTPGAAPVWRERARIDVVFQTANGLAFDVPSLESLLVPQPTIEEGVLHDI